MLPLETLFLLVGLSLGPIVAGYGLAARLTAASLGERLAAASLAGLCLLLWNVSALAFFHPIAGAGAWLCLWPLAWTALDRRARSALVRDLATAARHRRAARVAAAGAIFLLALLAPLLLRSDLVFYDGTSNHDAFFWISGAEYLKRFNYMTELAKSATQPFFDGVGVIIGWQPRWGRMGGEGLLALVSAIVHVSPLKLYVAASAALFIPWVAATFLVVRTFLVTRLTTTALIALVTLQPLFVYFHGNANLPNLLGVLTGALVVLATERSLRGRSDRGPWLALLALGVHGLLCSYPELVPFILVPGALLWLRTAFAAAAAPAGPRLRATFLAYLAGLALNPVSTIRAGYGFLASFQAARLDDIWVNIFHHIPLPDYLPGLLTMNLQTRADLGRPLAALCNLLLLAALLAVLRRAHDRLGALLTLSGAALLLAYTLVTDFNYGWQKTAQFAAVFTAALLPVAAIDCFARPAAPGRPRLLLRAVLVGLLAFSTYATARNLYSGYKWSGRKAITADWFGLRDYARDHLAGSPVLVDAPSFRMAFFHGMWATYFLADASPVFTDRGHQNGGYLSPYVEAENRRPRPAAPVLVGAGWADTWDANSPRLFQGEFIALLARANRVTALHGLDPENGGPDFAAGAFGITLRPHHRSRLDFTLEPRPETPVGAVPHWRIRATAAGTPAFQAELAGPPPWRFSVPLVAGRDNRIEVDSDFRAPTDHPFPFAVRGLRVETVP